MLKILLLITLACLLLSCQSPHKNDMNQFTYSKPMQGDYWALRYSYPTNKFNPSWLTNARVIHYKNTSKTPKGEFNKNAIRGAIGLDPSSFTALGPEPLNTLGGSAYSGRVNVIITHPSNPSIAYIGVDGGGVWKTTDCCDSTTTWTNMTDNTPVNGSAIGDLHMDPNNSAIIYAGTGDLRYGSYSFGSSGLLRSNNSGVTWEVLGEDVFSPYRDQPPGEFPQYQAIGKIRTNPNDSTQIVVGTKTGVFFSFNNGSDWVGPCLTDTHSSQRHDITGLEVNSTGKIFAAVGTRGHNTPVQPDLDQNGANGIYSTPFPTSSCPSWTLLSTSINGWPSGTGEGTPIPANSLGRIDLTMAPSDNDVLYAQVADVSTRAVLGVWKTNNAGIDWVKSTTTSEFLGCDDSGSQAWYDMGMSVSPNDSDVVFLSAVDLFKSSNGADSFTNSTCGYSGGPNSGDFVHVDHHSRAFVAGDDTKLLVGSDGGIYYTANADESNPRDIIYTQLNDTVNTIEFYSGDITENFANSTLKSAIGGAQDNGSSAVTWDTNSETVTAKPWTRINGGDGIYATIEPINGQRAYVESQFGNMRISTTGVLGSYTNFSSPWSNDSRVPFIFPFHLNKHDCVTQCEQLMAGTYRIWETSTGGLSDNDWYINSPDLTKATLEGRSIINQMHYGISDASIAIVGTNDGNVQMGFNMGAGTANSANWVDVTDNNNVLPNRPILDVVTDGIVATTAYAAVGGFDQNTPATPGHLYQLTCTTSCSSFTWVNKSGNLPNIPANSVMVNPNIPSMVFAGTDWGLYYTEDITVASPIWFRFTQGLPSAMIWDMTIDRGATTLAVFMRSRGAYVWPLPTTLITDVIYKDGFE